jgi:hypothetical protein
MLNVRNNNSSLGSEVLSTIRTRAFGLVGDTMRTLSVLTPRTHNPVLRQGSFDSKATENSTINLRCHRSTDIHLLQHPVQRDETHPPKDTEHSKVSPMN